MKKSKLFIFVLVVVQAAVSGCQSKSNKNNSENTDKQSIIVSKIFVSARVHILMREAYSSVTSEPSN